MKCKLSDWCCVYHACMSNECQQKIVLSQVPGWGAGRCEKENNSLKKIKKQMKKVTIEVTEKGWKTTVELDGRIFTEKHEATRTGAKCIEGNFENNEPIGDKLLEALQGFAMYDIMNGLQRNL